MKVRRFISGSRAAVTRRLERKPKGEKQRKKRFTALKVNRAQGSLGAEGVHMMITTFVHVDAARVSCVLENIMCRT